MTHSEQIKALAIPFILSRPAAWWTTLHEYPHVMLSSDGEVLSLKNRKPRLLKGTMRGQYLALSSVTKGPYLHSLILETFIGPRPRGAQARHLDGNRLNNRLENLEWGTPKENAADSKRHGTNPVGERNAMAKLTASAVQQMRSVRSETGLSFKAIAKRFGVSTMTAYRAVVGQSWK